MKRSLMSLRRIYNEFVYQRAADFALKNFKYPALENIKSFHMSTIAERQKEDPVEIRDLAYGLKYEDHMLTFRRYRASYDDEQGKWAVSVQKFRIFESELDDKVPVNAGQTEQHECPTGEEALALMQQLHDDILYKADDKYRFIAADHYPDGTLPAHIVGKIARGETPEHGTRTGPQDRAFSMR